MLDRGELVLDQVRQPSRLSEPALQRELRPMIVTVHGAAWADIRSSGAVIWSNPERINERIQSIAQPKRPVRSEPIRYTGLNIEIVHRVRCSPGQLVQAQSGQAVGAGSRYARYLDDGGGGAGIEPENLPGAELCVAKQQCRITNVVEGPGADERYRPCKANARASPEK